MHSGNSYILKLKNQDLVTGYQSEAEVSIRILVQNTCLQGCIKFFFVGSGSELEQLPLTASEPFHSDHSKDLSWKNAAGICSG